MAYKTKAQRREGGGYDFSFGAKSKKLLAVAEKVAGKWQITTGFASALPESFTKLRDLKVAWGELAAASYGRDPLPPSRNGPPSIRKGPPQLKPKPAKSGYDVPTCDDCLRPITGWFDDMPPCRCNVFNDVDYTPDPFDVNMYDSSIDTMQPRVSALGALDMVYHWMLRSSTYIQSGGVADSPWKEVQELLWRTLGYAEYRPDRFAAFAEPEEPAGEQAGESIAGSPAGNSAAGGSADQ